MARQMQENFRVKGKKLYFVFLDLEKAFDRVPREVISWAMGKLGVEEWLVSAVMSMYIGAKTVFRTVCGNSKRFEVKVGMHQGSALSPLLFVIVMEAYLENLGLPCHGNCCMLIRYDTRCYFNVRSKADISRLNLPHGTDN